MAMPTNVPIIDTMIGFPSTDRREIYKFLAPNLRDSESRFRSFFDHALIGMAVISPTREWLLVNPALNLSTFLSLYRHRANPPYSAAEMRLNELVMPHLWAAWTSNWIAQLASARAHTLSSGVALAVADLAGNTLSASSTATLTTETVAPVAPAASVSSGCARAGGENTSNKATQGSRVRDRRFAMRLNANSTSHPSIHVRLIDQIENSANSPSTASSSIMIQTAGPAQSWNLRTVSMPR